MLENPYPAEDWQQILVANDPQSYTYADTASLLEVISGKQQFGELFVMYLTTVFSVTFPKQPGLGLWAVKHFSFASLSSVGSWLNHHALSFP